MKAAVLRKIGQPLSVEQLPEPQPGPDEVLVRTRACGVCRTDLHIQDGLAYVPSLPHIPGHEPAGVVATVGRNVTEFQPGDRVVPHLFVVARECAYTRAGQHAQATHLAGIIGVTLPGGFAEYFKAPARNLLKLPAAVPFEVGGLTSCAVITAVHAYRLSDVRQSAVAVVLGAGGIGLMLIQLLRSAGARVVAVSRSRASWKLATEAGAECCVALDDPDLAARVIELAGADRTGADCILDTVGTAQTMQAAAACVRRCGKIVVIGEEPEFPPVDTIHIAQRELQIIGSRNGGLQDARDALELLARGVIRPVIARRFALDEIREAMDYLRSDQAQGRIVITVG